ncbi:MAG: hypothetical protein XD69_0623 [Clostridia bacterium 62_21]|nr:MAG: hypothetical protein XD69_0623 [Clostridia bacterium 62_21]
MKMSATPEEADLMERAIEEDGSQVSPYSGIIKQNRIAELR